MMLTTISEILLRKSRPVYVRFSRERGSRFRMEKTDFEFFCQSKASDVQSTPVAKDSVAVHSKKTKQKESVMPLFCKATSAKISNHNTTFKVRTPYMYGHTGRGCVHELHVNIRTRGCALGCIPRNVSRKSKHKQ